MNANTRANTIGFVGLGAMGSGMAANLVAAGRAVVGYDINDARNRELADLGASIGLDPANVASRAATVVTMVDTTAQTREVLLGERGAAAGARSGDLVICTSTVEPTAIIDIHDRLRESEISMIDAGVTGMIKGAREGTLRALVGGDAADLERARFALEPMTSDIVHVGPVGRGVMMKLINNMLYKVNSIAAIEAMVLGAKAGIDPVLMRDVITASTGNSVAFGYRAQRIIDRDFDGVRLDISCKDLELEGGLGRAFRVPLFMQAVCSQVYEMGRAAGLGDRDATALVTIYEQLTGTKVTPRQG
ncbi:NAD(P)-dependent oxidoreductase [Saccharomonospora sp. NPDC046836]|uniref:NAD(P)-dependent oxidoreductase n=1 Tax=Saccharomonospora sp. NPDC046836 TaxID=3156921 RepID=UPI0033FB461E